MKTKIDCIVGIDPGASGAIAVWRPDRPVEVKKMPDDLNDLSAYFQHLKDIAGTPLIFLEKMQLRPDDMKGGKVFRVQKLLSAYEQLKAIITFSGIPYILVAPMKWQSALHLRQKGENKAEVEEAINRILAKRREKGQGVNATILEDITFRAEKQIRKNRYKDVAQKHYPEVRATLENCDALLLCHFGRFMNFTNPEWILENLPQPLHGKIALF